MNQIQLMLHDEMYNSHVYTIYNSCQIDYGGFSQAMFHEEMVDGVFVKDLYSNENKINIQYIMLASLLCGYTTYVRHHLHVNKVEWLYTHILSKNAYRKWTDVMPNVAVISMYNILEINYSVMLVHFHEGRHDLQLEDVCYSQGFAMSVNVGQLRWSLPLDIPLSNLKILYRQMYAHATSELSHGSQK